MELSTDAKVILGLYWGIMTSTEWSFDRPHTIHPRTRSALDELVERGFLTVERFNDVMPKLVWKPTEKMKTDKPEVSMSFIRENSFPITTE